MNFPSIQWSTDGSASSEPMGLCMTSIVKTVKPLHSVKCTAWVAISKHGIIRPFWSEDDNERSVTINTERYVQVLGKVDGEGSSGSSSGSSRMVPPPTPQMNHWHGYSSVSLTDWSAAGVTRSGRRIHRIWTPPDFCLWDALRTGCVNNNPQANPDLKAAITAAIGAISREECGRVIENFARRIQMCLPRRRGVWNKEFL